MAGKQASLGKYVGLRLPATKPIAQTQECKQLAKITITFSAEYLEGSNSQPPRLCIGVVERRRDGAYSKQHYAMFYTVSGIKELIRVACEAGAYYLARRFRLDRETVKNQLIPVIREALEAGIKKAERQSPSHRTMKLVRGWG